MKKLFAILMVVAMVLALSAPAFAAAGGSITVTNGKAGETYSIYKIFDMTWDGSSAYTYTLPVGSPWEAFFATTGAGSEWISIGPDTRIVRLVKTMTEAENRDFADAMMEFIDTNSAVTALKTIKPTEDGAVVFDGLERGYYLVNTSVATVCVLRSNTANLELTDKSRTTTVDKQVQEDDTGEWGDAATQAIGQEVSFRAIIRNVSRASNLVFHDKMSAGLTFKAITEVYTRTATTQTPVTVPATAYTLKTEGLTAHSDGSTCTFEVSFTDEYLHTLTDTNSYIVIQYTATVNANAVISQPDGTDEGNPNDAAVSYGNAQWSEWDRVTVRTFPINVFKYTVQNGKNVALAGAEFAFAKVVKAADGTEQWQYVKAINEKNIPTELLAPVAADKDNVPADALRFTSKNDGSMIVLNGLDAPDEYILVEVKAPDGYNKLSDVITFIINAENDAANHYNMGYVRVNNGTAQYKSIDVENNTGTKLPETGGMGTKIFLTVGSLVALAAFVVLVARKRTSVYTH